MITPSMRHSKYPRCILVIKKGIRENDSTEHHELPSSYRCSFA